MKVLAFGTVAMAAVILVGGCSSEAPTRSQGQAVQGGTTDTTHDYAVGVCVGNGPGQCQLICSGALIAPNLVMTARHCVDQPSSMAIDCTSTTFGSQYAPDQYFYITTYYQMMQTTAGWHQVKQIFTTPGSLVCGNDMALLMLSDNVSTAEAGGSFVTPVVQYSMTDHTRYETSVTAIGYGDTSATTMDAGTRHILENIDLECIPNDAIIPCPSDPQLSTNEFVSGDSTCEGDSGSSAYEQGNFNKNIPVSFGVLSRGGTSGSTCIQPVYTRTDAWASFIISTAETAASDGGYTAPPWTQPPPPPPPDGGTEDASTTADGGPPPPPPGTLGAPCGDNSDCDSGICESDNGGQTWICSQHCQASLNGSDCGLPNYQCLGADDSGMGYCFPAPSSNSNSSSGGGGGCAVGHSDPSKPVPWGTLMLGGTFIGVGVIRQKQRKRSKD